MLRKRDPNALRGTGSCKPAEGELDNVLKSAAAEDLEGKMWHIEGEPSWKGLVEPQRAEPASKPSNQDRGHHRSPKRTEHKNRVSMVGINIYSDVRTPLHLFPVTLPLLEWPSTFLSSPNAGASSLILSLSSSLGDTTGDKSRVARHARHTHLAPSHTDQCPLWHNAQCTNH